MGITQRQQKYLFDRLNEIRNTKPSHYAEVNILEPIAVKVARRETIRYDKIISRFDKRKYAAKQKRNRAISAIFEECRRTILFGDAKKALAALDRFEKKTFLVVILFLTSLGFAHAQTTTPTLTTTEKIALHSIALENQQLQQELQAIKADIANSHPGFHLDPANPLSGELIPDAPKPPSTKK